MINMNKTKIFIIAATLAALAAVAIIGAAYVQNLNAQTYSANPSGYSQTPAGTNGANGIGGSGCRGISGTYAGSLPQSGYSYGMGARGGMMGGYR